MLKPIKNLLVDNAIYLAIIITISITILSLIKDDNLSISSESDKINHLIAYFCLTFSWLYAFSKKKTFHKKIKYIILACIIFGIIIEVVQGTATSHRTASFLDIVANTIGVVFAVLAFHLFEKKNQVF